MSNKRIVLCIVAASFSVAALSAACAGPEVDSYAATPYFEPDAAEDEYRDDFEESAISSFQQEESSTLESVLASSSTTCAYSGDAAPILHGGMVATARVLTQNMYGKTDSTFCDGGPDCSTRLAVAGATIAGQVQTYDVVGVQEVNEGQTCSCDGVTFVDGIRNNGDLDYVEWGYPSAGWDGGIGIFSTSAVTAFNQEGTDNGGSNHSSGHIFARTTVDSLAVDYYVVHLKSGPETSSISQRKVELERLRDDIEEQSASSGNPVIVMGDFNIGGLNMNSLAGDTCEGNEGYEDIMEVLGNPRDIWLEAHGSDGVEGATVDGNTNSLAKDDEHKRIDFMFVVTAPSLTNSSYDVVVSNPSSVSLWRGYVGSSDGSYGGPVSDHWGLRATLEFREKVSFPAFVAAVL